MTTSVSLSNGQDPPLPASAAIAAPCDLCRTWVPITNLRAWSPAMKPTIYVCDRCHPEPRNRDPVDLARRS